MMKSCNTGFVCPVIDWIYGNINLHSLKGRISDFLKTFFGSDVAQKVAHERVMWIYFLHEKFSCLTWSCRTTTPPLDPALLSASLWLDDLVVCRKKKSFCFGHKNCTNRVSLHSVPHMTTRGPQCIRSNTWLMTDFPTRSVLFSQCKFTVSTIAKS